MIIRPADIEKDALAIIDGARDFASRIALKHMISEDNEMFIKSVSRIVSLDGMEVLLADDDDEIVGGIGILYAPYIWNSAILVADELFWWCKKGAPFRTGKRLIDEAMKKVHEKGAIPMFRSLTTSPPGVDRIYREFQMFPVETVHTWLLPHPQHS